MQKVTVELTYSDALVLVCEEYADSDTRLEVLSKLADQVSIKLKCPFTGPSELIDLERELSNICSYSHTKTQSQLCLRFIELKSKVRQLIQAYHGIEVQK